MKMQAKLLIAGGLMAIASTGFSQYMAGSQAAMNMQDTINGQMGAPGFGGPQPVPGQVPGVGNPGVGFGGAPMAGNTIPALSGIGNTGLGYGGVTGQPGQAAFAAPTPIPTETVLTGRRVYDAVSGALLEDAVEITVRQSDADVFADDGVNDNGIAGDGIRGNVNTSMNQFIGQFSNSMKSYLIHAIRNAESIDPMVYYGYHVAKIDPRPVDGLKRYGLPLPGEGNPIKSVVNVEPDFASVLQLENDRDELLRRWNYEFLAEYRVIPNDPQSEYYPVFIPSPPLTPSNYPIPNGYVAPQAVAIASRQAADAAAAADAASKAASKANSRSSAGGSGGGGMPGGI